jgi:hypothetical protein
MPPGLAASTASWIVAASFGTSTVSAKPPGTASRPGPTSPRAPGRDTSPTSTTPAMPEPGAPWYSQKYGKTPGCSNVLSYPSSDSSAPESHEPSSARTVCGVCPSMVHSTVPPGSTRTTDGENRLSIALTVAPLPSVPTAGVADARVASAPTNTSAIERRPAIEAER